MKLSIKDISAITIQRGLKTRKINKSRMLKTIQLDEGNFDCFGTAYDGLCDQIHFAWRSDCLRQHKIRAQ